MALRRGIVIVLALFGLFVLVPVTALVFLYLAASRGPAVPSDAMLVLRPGGELHEVLPDDVLGQVLGGDALTVRSFVANLQKAKRDPRIRAVLLLPSGFTLPFWGKVQELRDAILDFRESGKPVIAFLEYGGDREYYLATAADRVYLLPTSPLDLSGVASYQVFLRGTLDKLGAYPDFVKIGPYKTGANQLTETEMTPEHREMTEWLNGDLYEQLVRGIAEARRMTVQEVRALIDQGPFVPGAARDAGLVDGLAYQDQLDDLVPELRSESGEFERIEGSTYGRVSARSVGIQPRSRIALLHASGVITSGRSRFDSVNGAVVGSETMVEQIRRIRDDDSIRAIVLRVDSPGGSAVASDVIWRELAITRDANPGRPLIASMSDLAASGGYYIAMPAETIVAQPGTLTGSIGIYGGKVVLEGTAEKVGITTGTVRAGTNASMSSPFERFTPEQRDKLFGYMETFYRAFVEKAAESRGKTPDQVDAVGQGRVWTGRQAHEHGLVDELGGLDVAIALAKARAGIPADEDVELVVYPPRRTLLEVLAEQLGSPSAGVWSVLAGGEQRALAALAAPVRLFRSGEPLALMPVELFR